MLNHLTTLSQAEKDLVLHAPLYVSLLIAGADGDINNHEKERILELIHTKTFSERYELREMYKEIDHDAASEMRRMIAELPESTEERNSLLSNKIAGLNSVFNKVDHGFAVQLYNSLRQFAAYVATADGGWWGIGSVTQAEKDLAKLPMLNNPVNQE